MKVVQSQMVKAMKNESVNVFEEIKWLRKEWIYTAAILFGFLAERWGKF